MSLQYTVVLQHKMQQSHKPPRILKTCNLFKAFEHVCKCMYSTCIFDGVRHVGGVGTRYYTTYQEEGISKRGENKKHPNEAK